MESPWQDRSRSGRRPGLQSLLGPHRPDRRSKEGLPPGCITHLTPGVGREWLRLPEPNQSQGDGLASDLTHTQSLCDTNTAADRQSARLSNPVQPVGRRGRHRHRIARLCAVPSPSLESPIGLKACVLALVLRRPSSQASSTHSSSRESTSRVRLLLRCVSRGPTPTALPRPASTHRSRRGASTSMSKARPSTTRATPAATIHPVAAPRPVNARDPELARMMGSDVLGLEDPELGFVAAATVVDGTGEVVVVEP